MASMYTGISIDDFKAVEQQDSSGCWAACVEMVCAHYGVVVSEHSEMELSFREGGNSGHSVAERLRHTTSPGVRPFNPDPLVLAWDEAVRILSQPFQRNEPVILCLRKGSMAHAVVGLGALTNNKGQLLEVTIADPSPQKPWGKKLTSSQLAEFVFEVVFPWANQENQAYVILVDVARRRELISYGRLGASLRPSLEANSPILARILGNISSSEHRRGQGMLSVLVVHKDGDQRPGGGFFTLADQLGIRYRDRDELWLSQLNLVHGTHCHG